QTAIANNMANAATTGFRAEVVNAKAKHLSSAQLDSRAIADERVFAADLASAPVTATRRPLDIALEGDAMLLVQSRNGETAYTRRCGLNLNASGLVTSGAGERGRGDDGPLAIPPGEKISSAKDGGVWIVPQGGDGSAIQQVDRLALVPFTGSDIVKG